VDSKFCHQKDAMAMGSCLLPIISNIFMEHFEKLALDLVQYKPSWSGLKTLSSYK
jgi:hypothetical protein